MPHVGMSEIKYNQALDPDSPLDSLPLFFCLHALGILTANESQLSDVLFFKPAKCTRPLCCFACDITASISHFFLVAPSSSPGLPARGPGFGDPLVFDNAYYRILLPSPGPQWSPLTTTCAVAEKLPCVCLTLLQSPDFPSIP